MSASLVGSEMCIRDRFKACEDRSEQPEATDQPHQATFNRMNTDRLSSVSYTHLTLPTICSV
eukprot:12254377-Alexandrium_andersonii.AAC.1